MAQSEPIKVKELTETGETEINLNDFCTFSKLQLSSGDIDPTYSVLRWLYDDLGLDEETALWRTYIYLTYYKLSSAEKVWGLYPDLSYVVGGKLSADPSMRLPTGTERRGFRGNDNAVKNINHMLLMASEYGSLQSLFRNDMHVWHNDTIQTKKKYWDKARRRVEQIIGNGNWASYKWADLLKSVHGFPIIASDIGVGGNSKSASPVVGLKLITGKSYEECARDVLLQEAIMNKCIVMGVPFDGLDQFETCLCDYNTMCKGGYYVGHDIDQMMTGLTPDSVFWRAREAVFSPKYLGEKNGWVGVRKEMKKRYKDGKIGW